MTFHEDSAKNPNFDPLLCDMIVKYRARNNLTQKQFAEKLGVSLATVINIENGRRGPNKTNRIKILDLIAKGR